MPTIGVAVDIPEPFGSYLQERREHFGDPLAYAIPPHITLLPPTEVAEDELAVVEAHCAAVAAAADAFTVELTGTGTFRPVSPVVFVRVTRGMDECARMEQAIRSGPIERPLDFDYHPHVTIAHHVSEAQLDAAEAGLATFTGAFVARAVHLYHHGADEIWRPVVAFELRRQTAP
ncbi:2'-5' RNA ligase family protein [Nostocoides vanveenii]|uniref:2'-5' RNA ligase family protein n=1 Tax=Nostocoides vanveenii TaxID=330835 RepID=A0ABP4W9Z8_9MICO